MIILEFILTGLVIIALLAAAIYFIIETTKDIDALLPAYLFSIAFVVMIVLFSFMLADYQKPHHGNTPSLSDVPHDAHLVEIKTIIDNDTTTTYKVEWND